MEVLFCCLSVELCEVRGVEGPIDVPAGVIDGEGRDAKVFGESYASGVVVVWGLHMSM